MKLKFKLMHPLAKSPTRGTKGAAAFDLYSCESGGIPAGGFRVIELGIGFEIPAGHFGLVAQRSGLASRGMDIFGGIIDSDYRGSVKAFVFNGSNTAHNFFVGDRIAQIVILPCVTPALVEGELSETERGEKCMGSTGR